MRLSSNCVAFSAFMLYMGITNAATDEKKSEIACTAHSPNSGSFYDLRPLQLSVPDPSKSLGKGEHTESWHAKGYDYNGNFTLNICAPVIEELASVVGIDKSEGKNVSAYYEADGKTYSLGQQSSDLKFRGRKLVLQYTHGSPCADSSHKTREAKDSDEDKKSDSHRRKSTLISFQCEKDPLATQTSVAFIGTDPDECAYFFEVKSHYACGGAEPVQQTVGPAGVFGIIVMIAVLVYFIGGVVYQRNVAHARGWRQLPNYSMWAGIAGFFQDMFIIATSSCAQCLPRRQGYRSLSISADGNGSTSRGRTGRPEDENRLIDQLDEEWDD